MNANTKAAAVIFTPFKNSGGFVCLISPYNSDFVAEVRGLVRGILFDFDKRVWYAPKEERAALFAAASEYWDVIDLVDAVSAHRTNDGYKRGYEDGRNDEARISAATIAELRKQVRTFPDKLRAEFQRGRQVGRSEGTVFGTGERGRFGNSSPNSPYKTLHVEDGAPKEVCEAAYKVLVRKYHPDVAGPSGHEKTVALNRAMDELKRRWP